MDRERLKRRQTEFMSLEVTRQLNIMFFSILREILGRRSEAMTLDNPEPVSVVLDRLVAHYPEIARYRTSMRVAVNMEYVDEQYVVFNGDELALITPVSGG